MSILFRMPSVTPFVLASGGTTDPTDPVGEADVSWFYQNSMGQGIHHVTQGDFESLGAARKGRSVCFTVAYDGEVLGFLWQSQAARWWGDPKEGGKGSPTTSTAANFHSHGDPKYIIRVYKCDSSGTRTSTLLATSPEFWPCSQSGSGGFDASNPELNPEGNAALTEMRGGLKIIKWMNLTKPGGGGKFVGSAIVMMPLYKGNGSNTSEFWEAKKGDIVEVCLINLSAEWWLNWCGGNDGVCPHAPRPATGMRSPHGLADPWLNTYSLNNDEGRTRNAQSGIHTPCFLLCYRDNYAFGQPTFYQGGSNPHGGFFRTANGALVSGDNNSSQDNVRGKQGVRQVFTPREGFDSGVMTHIMAWFWRWTDGGAGTGAMRGRLLRRPVGGGNWEQVWPLVPSPNMPFQTYWQNFTNDCATMPKSAGSQMLSANSAPFPNWGSSLRNAFSDALKDRMEWCLWALPADFRFTGAYTYAMELSASTNASFGIGRSRNLNSLLRPILASAPQLITPQIPPYGSSGRSYNRAEWSPDITIQNPVWNQAYSDHQTYPITYVKIAA